MLTDWTTLDAREHLEELIFGAGELPNRNALINLLAILISEHDIEVREVMDVRNTLINVSGDILEYIDINSGELILE